MVRPGLHLGFQLSFHTPAVLLGITACNCQHSEMKQQSLGVEPGAGRGSQGGPATPRLASGAVPRVQLQQQGEQATRLPSPQPATPPPQQQLLQLQERLAEVNEALRVGEDQLAALCQEEAKAEHAAALARTSANTSEAAAEQLVAEVSSLERRRLQLQEEVERLEVQVAGLRREAVRVASAGTAAAQQPAASATPPAGTAPPSPGVADSAGERGEGGLSLAGVRQFFGMVEGEEWRLNTVVDLLTGVSARLDWEEYERGPTTEVVAVFVDSPGQVRYCQQVAGLSRGVGCCGARLC